eukprot:TRINITY_DN18600_c0_g1_i1.p1 TRINITY_DN18600_c0_g1~~TRINITY_DN18600_c0_g1_i1.p1  ORF type:complete len:735 (+),score=91.77 TRINITY_DN18600_c0_g1_i1:136-2205(+)
MASARAPTPAPNTSRVGIPGHLVAPPPRAAPGLVKHVSPTSSYVPSAVVTPKVPPKQEPVPMEVGGMVQSCSQAAIASLASKAASSTSPPPQARVSRGYPPNWGNPGGKLPGCHQELSPQQHFVRAVATPLRAAEETSGTWSYDCAIQLCREGEEACFAGRGIRLLDRLAVTSVKDAVDNLNRRLVFCPEDCCIVLSAAEQRYYLLHKRGRREQSLPWLGHEEGAARHQSPTRAAYGWPGMRQDSRGAVPGCSISVAPPGCSVTATEGGRRSIAEISRQNSFAAVGVPAQQLVSADERSRCTSPFVRRPGQGAFGGPAQVQSYMPAPTGALAKEPTTAAGARYGSPSPQRTKVKAAQSYQPAPRVAENVPTRPLAARLAQAPPSVAKPAKTVVSQTVSPTQLRLCTPRDYLESDLTEPEKVRYADLEFTERLGQGEFGEVFRGVYRNEEVAIKQLFFDENMTELINSDLAREIESFRHLKHKRLVRFIGACLEMPHLCLVTEYMPGGSLHHFLHVKKKSLPLDHACNICAQIADGVQYLHSQNPKIVHRDLKSLNVVLDLSLNVKICDFGLTESMERTHITKKNNGGSPRYMAPELFDCKTKITERIDVWAMGCIFVEICGGPLPYEQITTLADLTKEMLVHRRVPDIPGFIHEEMRRVCASCLSFDYRKRPSSKQAWEMLKAAKRAIR